MQIFSVFVHLSSDLVVDLEQMNEGQPSVPETLVDLACACAKGPTKNSVTWQEEPHGTQKGGVNQICTANRIFLKLAFP